MQQFQEVPNAGFMNHECNICLEAAVFISFARSRHLNVSTVGLLALSFGTVIPFAAATAENGATAAARAQRQKASDHQDPFVHPGC